MIGPDLYTFRELWRQYRICRRNRGTLLGTCARALAAGFPVRLSAVFRARALSGGFSVIEVREQGWAPERGCRRRTIVDVSIPAALTPTAPGGS